MCLFPPLPISMLFISPPQTSQDSRPICHSTITYQSPLTLSLHKPHKTQDLSANYSTITYQSPLTLSLHKPHKTQDLSAIPPSHISPHSLFPSTNLTRPKTYLLAIPPSHISPHFIRSDSMLNSIHVRCLVRRCCSHCLEMYCYLDKFLSGSGSRRKR